MPVRDLKVWPDFNTLKLSPDGRYLLSFWHDERLSVFSDEMDPLTVFDAVSGEALQKGSMMDEKTGVISSPHAWLPDGSYVYMVANKLYKSTPGLGSSKLLAILKLPSNSVFGDGEMIEGQSELAVSPDGQRIAFSWAEKRGNDMDTNIWVARLDGSDLHRLTRGKTDSALRYLYGPPAWSPDGKWVLGWLGMTGVNTAPVNPLDWDMGWRVVGWTGCGRSPVFVVGVDERDVEISWPDMNDKHVLRARSPDGQSSLLVTACDRVSWVR
jgi:Tol biopolymer transport system component